MDWDVNLITKAGLLCFCTLFNLVVFWNKWSSANCVFEAFSSLYILVGSPPNQDSLNIWEAISSSVPNLTVDKGTSFPLSFYTCYGSLFKTIELAGKKKSDNRYENLQIYSKNQSSTICGWLYFQTQTNNLLHVIEDFSACSRQLINFHKSVVYFSNNMSPTTCQIISGILQVRELDIFDEKYRGLPFLCEETEKYHSQHSFRKLI